MASNKRFRFGPLALTSDLTTNLLSPPSVTGGVNAGSSPLFIEVNRVTIVNRTSATHTVSLWLGASGTNTTGKEVIASGRTVTGRGALEWVGMMRLDEGEFLVGGADDNDVLTIEGEGQIGVA